MGPALSNANSCKNSALFYFNIFDGSNELKLSVLTWNANAKQNEVCMLDNGLWSRKFKNHEKFVLNYGQGKRFVGYGFDTKVLFIRFFVFPFFLFFLCVGNVAQ